MKTKKGRSKTMKTKRLTRKRLTRKRTSKKTIRRNHVNKNRKQPRMLSGGVLHRSMDPNNIFGTSKHYVFDTLNAILWGRLTDIKKIVNEKL